MARQPGAVDLAACLADCVENARLPVAAQLAATGRSPEAAVEHENHERVPCEHRLQPPRSDSDRRIEKRRRRADRGGGTCEVRHVEAPARRCDREALSKTDVLTLPGPAEDQLELARGGLSIPLTHLLGIDDPGELELGALAPGAGPQADSRPPRAASKRVAATCYRRDHREEPIVHAKHRIVERGARAHWATLVAASITLLAVGLGCGPPSESRRFASEEEIQRFVATWYLKQNFFRENRWFGIETLQNPLDAWVTQEIISEVRPDLIVETGTNKGGSALMWATILGQLNPEGRVVTIDIKNLTQDARRHPIWAQRVRFLKGSSVDPRITNTVKQLADGKRVLVILDSAHTREHVLEELKVYAELVPVGGYVIVQDTGAWKASASEFSTASLGVADFLASTDAFESDLSRERFMLTNNPTGFLKRIR